MQFVVLDLVGVRLGALVLPEHLARVVGDLADLHEALRALELLVDPVVAAGELLALARDAHAVGVREVHRVMVVDLAGLSWRPLLTPADAVRAHRQRVQEPVRHVDVVDVLLADVVTAEPVEVVPVVHLELHLVLALLALAIPDAGAVPVDLPADEVAREPLAHLFERGPVDAVVVPLESDDDLELLFVGHLRRLEAQPRPEAVDAHRLLHEDVLAGLDGRVEVERPEAGGRREDDEVAVVEHLLVAVEALELTVLGDVHLAFHAFDRLERPLDAVLEGIGDRGDLHVRSRHGEGLLEGTRATTAGTDQADADQVGRRALGVDGGDGESGTHGTGGPQGVTAIQDGAWGGVGALHRGGSSDVKTGLKRVRIVAGMTSDSYPRPKEYRGKGLGNSTRERFAACLPWRAPPGVQMHVGCTPGCLSALAALSPLWRTPPGVRMRSRPARGVRLQACECDLAAGWA